MLALATTASIIISGNKLRAGCSADADTVDPDRDNESLLPRVEPVDGSSLDFIVRSFPASVACEERYYDLC